jgi:quercetin dioxygenase-like cupin family protein
MSVAIASQQSSKHYTSAAGKGKTLLVLDELVEIKLTGADTDGKFEMVQQVTQAGSGVPFLHAHPFQETFYVLDGEFEFYGQQDGEKYAVQGGKGFTIQIPFNAPHGFKNVGSTPGTMLAVFEPAGVMVNFFNDLGVEVDDPANPPAPTPPDMAKVGGLFQKYGFKLLENPGGPNGAH